MDHAAAVDVLASLETEKSTAGIRWLTPIATAMLAAMSMHAQHRRGQLHDLLRVYPGCLSYATNCGLIAILEGRYSPPSATGLQGRTYSAVTRLQSHHEVDACNAVMSNLFHARFSEVNPLFMRALTKVVGELHDNVPSHSRGTGFSSAQCYRQAGGDVIQFAIADCGVGMLRNVRRKMPEVATDDQAIDWCLKRGHTTAGGEHDEWSQRLPEDSLFNPYPTSVTTVTSDNHHQGLGLWHLREIVDTARGGFWVASGSSQCRYMAGAETPLYDRLTPVWPGVAIEVELPIPAPSAPAPLDRARLEHLAERLGL